MARGSPPPLPDDPELLAKPAHDEVAEMHAADSLPPPPPPPPPLPTAPSISSPPPMPTPVMMPSAPQTTQSSAAPTSNPFEGSSSSSENSVVSEHWAKAFWRPAMGWLYMVICFMDFVGFPLLTIFLPIIFKPFGLVMPYQAWTSLTLSNGGLIHLAFGAILGVSAFSRGQEKIANK